MLKFISISLVALLFVSCGGDSEPTIYSSGENTSQPQKGLAKDGSCSSEIIEDFQVFQDAVRPFDKICEDTKILSDVNFKVYVSLVKKHLLPYAGIKCKKQLSRSLSIAINFYQEEELENLKDQFEVMTEVERCIDLKKVDLP